MTTLLVLTFAAIIATVVWYKHAPGGNMREGVLCLIYWGAFLMWLVDSVFTCIEEGSAFFSPAPKEVLNDFLLGLAVVALGLLIWLCVVLVQDPRGVWRKR